MDYSAVGAVLAVMVAAALALGPVFQLLGIKLALPVKSRSDLRPALVAGFVTLVICSCALAAVLFFVPPPWRPWISILLLFPIASVGATVSLIVIRGLTTVGKPTNVTEAYIHTRELFEEKLSKELREKVRTARAEKSRLDFKNPIEPLVEASERLKSEEPSSMSALSALQSNMDTFNRDFEKRKAMRAYQLRFDIGCAQATFAALVITQTQAELGERVSDQLIREKRVFLQWIAPRIRMLVPDEETRTEVMEALIWSTVDVAMEDVGRKPSFGPRRLPLYRAIEHNLALCERATSDKAILKMYRPLFGSLVKSVSGLKSDSSPG